MSIMEFLDFAFVRNIEILIVLIATAVTCSIVGTFLVLRKLSMVSDAISHSVLLGIVLAFFITKDVGSPLLIFGAAIFGVITVFSIESLSKTGLVKNDDAVGVVFPLFFSLAVILITKFARNVHLDIDIVLMGEVIMAPLNRTNFFGLDLPKSLISIAIMFLINISFVILFFKELKLTTFDPLYAKISGFSSGLLFYALMTLTSFTTVIAFDAVGAILVVSFLITPAASAYLITKDLKKMLIISAIYAIINSILGYIIGMSLNLSISGMSATFAGITFLLTFMFNQEGMLRLIITKKKRREEFKEDLFILHLGNHINEKNAEIELGLNTIKDHLMWSDEEVKERSEKLIEKGLVKKDNKMYVLTNDGKKRYNKLKLAYGL